MTEDRHTPGPWKFDSDWGRIPTIFGQDGAKVASIEKLSGSERTAAQEANARLIAATPAILGFVESIQIYEVEGDEDRLWLRIGSSPAVSFKKSSQAVTTLLHMEAARRMVLAQAKGE